nr:PREDICTED: uncharacterized protein LOC100565889 isoform X3 [Anolis carolinensis]|eukprot:XP_016847334.1 PREDICTED: uncharacterized protein LOC100565889 isoform X3 [Anolis carolinensis]
MIGKMLFWALIGTSTAKDISTEDSWVTAAVHQTALLPFSFHPSNAFWRFINIKWDFLTINKSTTILVYMVEDCSQESMSRPWWERECTIIKEVNDAYQQWADILRNGTLKIHPVQIRDAGIYQATILSSGARKHTATVNLTVTQGSGALRKFDTENMVRMVLACLIFCFLGLVVVEHGWRNCLC